MSIGEILAGQVITPVAEVTSFLGGIPLGAVPISQGDITMSASGDVLGRLEVTLPASPEWLPRHPGHPLAAYGQELVVRRGFLTAAGVPVEWRNLGRFRIDSAVPEGGWLTVSAPSIDARLKTAQWIVDTRTTGSYAQQAQRICSGVVPLQVLATDKPAAARTWEQKQSRRDSLVELCDAWGATLRMIDGRLSIVDAATPALSITISPTTGLVSAAPESASDQVPSVVVASTAPEGSTAPVSAMAVVESGPRRWTGPYGQVVEFFTSPLLLTGTQCKAAATTRLARLQTQGPDLRVSMATDPRISLGDVVRVIDPQRETDAVIQVTDCTYALTPGREPGELQGVVLSGRVEGVAR